VRPLRRDDLSIGFGLIFLQRPAQASNSLVRTAASGCIGHAQIADSLLVGDREICSFDTERAAISARFGLSKVARAAPSYHWLFSFLPSPRAHAISWSRLARAIGLSRRRL